MRSRPLLRLLLSAMLFALGLSLFCVTQRRHPGASFPRPPYDSLLQSTRHEAGGVLPDQPASPRLLRLSNTTRPFADLIRQPTAILLENALIDTALPEELRIPEHLRSVADPGSYLVQSRTPVNASFRRRLQEAGARAVSFLPNQSYLVRASRVAADRLRNDPSVQAVLAYEPYFKLKGSLLGLAVRQQPLAPDSLLQLLVFADARADAYRDLELIGLAILGEEDSPFGPVLTVRPETAGQGHVQSLNPNLLPAIAALSSVQAIERVSRRVLANDLSRARLAVAPDSTLPQNYLGLSGSNVLVSVSDSGIDPNHPDLVGRVFLDVPASGVDTNGHGTHVAGIIAGSGDVSQTVTNASGSVMPAVAAQFRGQAAAAQLLSLRVDPDPTPASDIYLQQTAAQSGARISNNSWNYANDKAYDLAAARYDAAVRDALPGKSGGQPLLFVFGAGNAGHGADDGSGGEADSILSPATAKNVLTVGAIEQLRDLTNQVWQCATVDGTNVCQTNQPWFGWTDSSSSVASFSSRGNVGVGIEGPSGRFKPDIVAPGTFIVSARSTQWDQAAYYGAPNASTDYSQVLSNLNGTLGSYYRYESGTSLAAAGASGMLALLQEFFQRFGQTNSPALLKALLINGSRLPAANLGYNVCAATNAQGWGLINLTNSIPPGATNLFSGASPVRAFDQDPGAALATGQRQTRYVCVSPTATNAPLRFTLVWTDPPGNPAAGVKLVNDLDLIVTNLVTGEVYLGNDFLPGDTNNRARPAYSPSEADVVNNVENVFLPASTAADYSVTVAARFVNVNAVTTRTNEILQDYALVISGGEGQVVDAVSVTDTLPVTTASADVVFLTNGFAPGQGVSGGLLLNERVGAQPIMGAALAQWRFYVLTNDQDYTNLAVATFLPPNLSLPRSGVDQGNVQNSTRQEADIDLYVSTDPSLTNLDPTALAAADKALSRRGSQALIYSNAASGGVYYVGVKAEDQEAAGYAFLGVFSCLPFAEQQPGGALVLRGINVPADIPDGAVASPAGTNVVAICPSPIAIRRVVITNTVAHECYSDLLGTLAHGETSVVLHHNTVPPINPAPSPYTWIYEDNGENDVPGSQPTDGPGSLRDFIGRPGAGVWLLMMSDSVLTQTGAVENLSLRLDPQNDLNGTDREVATNTFSFDFVDVPLGCTNLTICVTNDSGVPLPVELYVRRGTIPTLSAYDQKLSGITAAGCLSVNLSSLPPVCGGRYFIGVFNPNDVAQTIRLNVQLEVVPGPAALPVSGSAASVLIPDDAITNASLVVTNTQRIAALDVALLVEHPRVSDLVFTLISPAGKRVLLCENRGGTSTNGLGGVVLRTNGFPTRTSGDFNAQTNVLPVGQREGTLYVSYEFYYAPDSLHIYYDGALIFDSGVVNGAADIAVPFGPGASTNVMIIMNEGNNDNTNTLWEYTATVAIPLPAHVVFTERTNAGPVPIKFATPPYVPSGTNTDLYCLGEQSLNSLVGDSACGTWQLEIWDNRAGAIQPSPVLVDWQLRFLYQPTSPEPIALQHGVPGSNTIPPGAVAPFVVEVPDWATRATNLLAYASAPVMLLFNPSSPPSGTNAGDVVLLPGSVEGLTTFSSNSLPPLEPGGRYYLGVLNAGTGTVAAAVRVDFDVLPLTNQAPLNGWQLSSCPAQYFSFDVSSNATAVTFQLSNLTGHLALVAATNPLVPTLSNFSYGSFNPSSLDQEIMLFPESAPVPLAPGRWYLGALNATHADVQYTVRAIEYTNPLPPMITLQNGVMYPNANAGTGAATDYYHFVVTTNAVRAQFEIDDPTGDMALVAKKGLPLPTLTNYAYLSDNPGPNNELITIFPSSTPISLTPGDWFIAAINRAAAPVSYAVKATEFAVPGTNFAIVASEAVTNSLCLTWDSVPDLHYFVQGKTSLSSSQWTTISPTIVAAEVLTTWCVPLPSTNSFFRVSQGLVLTPYVPPVTISNVVLTTNGLLLQWSSAPTNQFQVQWSPWIIDPDWTDFSNVVSSTNGAFSFLDDGSQSGGLSAARCYRLRLLP